MKLTYRTTNRPTVILLLLIGVYSIVVLSMGCEMCELRKLLHIFHPHRHLQRGDPNRPSGPPVGNPVVSLHPSRCHLSSLWFTAWIPTESHRFIHRIQQLDDRGFPIVTEQVPTQPAPTRFAYAGWAGLLVLLLRELLNWLSLQRDKARKPS